MIGYLLRDKCQTRSDADPKARFEKLGNRSREGHGQAVDRVESCWLRIDPRFLDGSKLSLTPEKGYVARNKILMNYRILSVICALLLGSCLQLNGNSAQVGTQAAIIRNIAVRGRQNDLEVEISGTARLTPLTQTVTNPDRLIVDFPEASPGAGLRKVVVNRGNLTAVRVGLLSTHPQVTRVVLDLTSPTQFRLVPSGNMVVVRLGAESAPGVAAGTQATKPADANPTNSTSVIANALPDQPIRRNSARWILPILTTAAVLALLVMALVAHIQNKQSSRGH